MENDIDWRHRRVRGEPTIFQMAGDIGVPRFFPTLPVNPFPLARNNSTVPTVCVRSTKSVKRIKLETDVTEYLFKDEATKDFTIISGTGARVKCHKLVLKARSKWFETMLQNDQMAEVQSGKLKLNGMSDWGVNQLVRYLYGMEIPAAELTPDYALQLLQNGHAYELQGLVKDVGNVLVEMDKKWFKKDGADALLELYFFTQKLDKDAVMCRLNGHLLQIMSELPSEIINQAERFKELSKKDSINLFSKLHDILMAKVISNDN